jgi:hypothetical protein
VTALDHRHSSRPNQPPQTTVRAAALAAELRVLRKGRGLQHGQNIKRIGPTLRDLCPITDTDRPIDTLTKVADWLRDTVADLPPDLHLSTLGAFGLHEGARQPFYHDRVIWVARQLHRDPRTARRRIDKALDVLAQMAVQGQRTPVDLRHLVGRWLAITWSPGGRSEDDQTVRWCHLVAVAQALDDPRRHLAIVELLDTEGSMIAIPTTRIRTVVSIGGDQRSTTLSIVAPLDQQSSTIAIPAGRILNAASLDKTAAPPADDRPARHTAQRHGDRHDRAVASTRRNPREMTTNPPPSPWQRPQPPILPTEHRRPAP